MHSESQTLASVTYSEDIWRKIHRHKVICTDRFLLNMRKSSWTYVVVCRMFSECRNSKQRMVIWIQRPSSLNSVPKFRYPYLKFRYGYLNLGTSHTSSAEPAFSTKSLCGISIEQVSSSPGRVARTSHPFNKFN